MRALDLFCGAGGASVGLARAGFDVTGVDHRPQPRYPFEFVQADALTFPLDDFDFIWASPPCQLFSSATRAKDRGNHRNLIVPIRERLKKWGGPFVIENVVGAPLVQPITLCGAMFNLRVLRHRLFETNFFILTPPHPPHGDGLVLGEYVTVAGGGGVPTWTREARARRGLPKHLPGEMRIATWRAAMGIDWMVRRELSQAIPPAYSEFIARGAPVAPRAPP